MQGWAALGTLFRRLAAAFLLLILCHGVQSQECSAVVAAAVDDAPAPQAQECSPTADVQLQSGALADWLSGAIISLLVLGGILQLGCCMCLCIQGAPAARLVLLGVMSEAWALRSVSTACALLRLKRRPTPTLEVSGRVTDAGASELGSTIRAHGGTCRTQAVGLTGNPRLSCQGVASFCAEVLGPTCALKALDLSSNPQLGDGLGGTLAPYLAGRDGSPSCLRTLILVECGLTAAGVLELSKAAGSSVLVTLDLSQNKLEGAGTALAQLVEAPLLEDLRLVDCGLGDKDVAEMALVLPSSGLVSLDLAFNSIGSEGVLSLARHLGDAPLQSLSLVQNQIVSDEPLGQLAGAWAAQPRSQLDLVGNLLSKDKLQIFKKVLASLG